MNHPGDAGPERHQEWYPGWHLSGRFLSLRPATVEDVPIIVGLLESPRVAARLTDRVDHHGAGHMAHGIVASNFEPMLCVDQRQEPVGLAFAQDADLRNGNCAVSYLVSDEAQGRGTALEGIVLYLRHLMLSFPMWKCYFEVIDFNLDQFGSAVGRLLDVEGCLKEHELVSGQRRDVYLLSVSRPQVSEFLDSHGYGALPW